jgi:hypothetical protein
MSLVQSRAQIKKQTGWRPLAALTTLSFGPIGNIRGNCRRAFAITVLTNISPRGPFVPIIAAATINSSVARRPRAAAVISAADYCDWNGLLRCHP